MIRYGKNGNFTVKVLCMMYVCIYFSVIQGILKDKPRILVTHQLQFLKAANQIIILKEVQ